MSDSGGGSSAASQAVSGAGSINFGSDSNPWLIGGIVAGAFVALGFVVWLVTRK